MRKNLFELTDITKSYDGKTVLDRVSIKMKAGGIYCLMGPSGIGKTTLLRILMGLEAPDGREKWHGLPGVQISAVFQENRLCDFADAVKNIRMIAGKDELLFSPEQILCDLLEMEAWHRPVRELSGGMRRRVAVARALAARSDLLVLDEPFTGLDEAARLRTIQTILHYRAGRTLLVVTHQEEDAELLGGRVLTMEQRFSGTEKQTNLQLTEVEG